MIILNLFQTAKFIKRRKLCLKNPKKLAMLAWRVLCNNLARILDSLRKILFSTEFIQNHRTSSKAFLRNRKLPFHLLVCFIINFVKGSYQSELDRFFQSITNSNIAQRVVSKAAFAKARMKLTYDTFIDLNQHLINEFSSTFTPLTWNGFRLMSLDGSLLTLPKVSEIMDYFGAWHGRQGEPCPKARISQLYDPLNKLTIRALINPKSVGERQQAKSLVSNIPTSSLLLLDRGYPAFWLFKLLVTQHIEFCARICRKWEVVNEFIRSGKQEKIIELPPGTGDKHCKELGLDTNPIKLRLIRVELSSGEVEVLITSLIDQNHYPSEIFSDLYHKRWPVEEDYKIMKNRMEIEAFTGQSVHSIHQDFYANVFAKNLVTVLSFPAQEQLDSSGVKEKHPHQVNTTQLLGKAKHLLPQLFQKTYSEIKDLLQQFIDLALKITEPIRPERKYPRNQRAVKKQYYQNYKPAF